MEKSFIILRTSDSLESILKKTIIRKYLPQPLIDKWIIKNIPLETEEIDICDVTGNIVTLPVTDSIVEKRTEEYIKTIISKSIEKLMETKSTMYLVPNNIIKFIEHDILIADGKTIKFLLLQDILKKCISLQDIGIKDLKITIIDSRDTLVEYCIDLLYPMLNYLTVITDRPKYFSQKVEHIYEESGLVLEIIEKPLSENIDADIIINLDIEKDKGYYYYKKGTIIIDFISSKDKIKNILVKRRDILIIDDIQVSYNKENVDITKLELALFSQNRIFRNFMRSGYKDFMLEKMVSSIEKYNIKIISLSQKRYS